MPEDEKKKIYAAATVQVFLGETLHYLTKPPKAFRFRGRKGNQKIGLSGWGLRAML